ncbi:DUF4437 domain-containing protein [Paracoccus homiensis]|uniref:Cupin domain protein n=1 Tax=Paracoccus homiensis TaxID=364199 RepID=A0A1I0HWY4_9RHOB|nr:DUF4437 domain-containing protein [Paracoccus homiensis]SET88669.1 protein of unknown function [Paracoccus homiensis]
MKSTALLSATALALIAGASGAFAQDSAQIVRRADVTFQPLNPARGDASPQAGVLWGDIRQDVPTGAIIKFAPNFSSPPHIHNITYRGIVIEGAVHNDDPDAANMWMGPGSFWSQPAGEPHITSASGDEGATIFLEILEGPYLVQPTDEAFDNHEHPVNVEAGNIVWLDTSDVTWIDQPGAEGDDAVAQIAYLWGDAKGENGTFLRIPAGTSGTLEGGDKMMRAVTIAGDASVTLPDADAAETLKPGSYFGSESGGSYPVACEADEDCMLYVRTDGKYTFASL